MFTMGAIITPKIFGIIINIVIIALVRGEDNNICDKTPLGIKVPALRPDNQFILEVENIKEEKYIPDFTYKVILRTRNPNSKFIAFTISLKEDSLFNKDNPRKPTALSPGILAPYPDSKVAISSTKCANTVIQSDVTPKTRVEVEWRAPGKDNRCVSIFAVVAVSPSVWYNFEPPLSLKVCEDPRKSEDMPPRQVDGDCGTCEDARYKLTFEGLWAYNTHHDMFPSARELARFSDLVGASHSPDTSLFNYASEASIGIKMLAEQGNTTQFEIETQSKLPTGVRTVIKATKPEYTNMSTVTSFRATSHFHRLSMAVGILPSPDWFLGVTQLELCDDKTKNWKGSITLNLYPIDAGTDKGLDFESSNEEQSPPQPISPLDTIGKDKIKPAKPFARILVERVRTYLSPRCLSEEDVTEPEDVNEGQGESTDDNEDQNENQNEEREVRPYRPSYVTQRTTTTSEEPNLKVYPESSEKCPMTNWDEWSPCEGICTNGTLIGIQTRLRYYIVDGVILKDIENGPRVSQHCLNNYPDKEFQSCEDACNENEGEEDEEAEEETQGAGEASRWTWRNFK